MERGKGSAGSWDPALLMVELNQGHELTRRLETQLRDQHQQCPDDIRALVHGIMTSWEKAMSVAAAATTSSSSSGHMLMMQRAALTVDTSVVAAGRSESPRSASGSPPSGGSDVPVSDHEGREVSRKRKSGRATWTQQVQLSTGSNLESPIEDGHSWRKYGQKDILGARYPRAYYRCTHRHTQGCQATKHVQRTDDNPSLFDVTYKCKHTCFPRQQQQQDSCTPPPPAHHDSAATARTTALFKPTAETAAGSLHNVFMNFGTGGLTVKTEDATNDASSSPFSAFSFPPTPLSCPARPETNIFSCSSSSPTFAPACSGSGGLSSPPFLSPPTSDSNYFSMSPCHVSAAGGYAMGVVGTGGSMHTELAEIVSAATSTTSSPLVDLDFSPEDLDAALLDSCFFSWAK